MSKACTRRPKPRPRPNPTPSIEPIAPARGRIQEWAGTLAGRFPKRGDPSMIKRTAVFVLLAVVAAVASAQTPQQWTEGKQYFAIQNPQPTGQPDKVVVTEVFSFGCPACNQFEPYVDKLQIGR